MKSDKILVKHIIKPVLIDQIVNWILVLYQKQPNGEEKSKEDVFRTVPFLPVTVLHVERYLAPTPFLHLSCNWVFCPKKVPPKIN